MEEEKYRQLMTSLSNFFEDELETYEQVKFLFKRFVYFEKEYVKLKIFVSKR